MSSKKDTTTIVFLNSNQKCSKTIRVRTYYLRNWRNIVFFLCLFIFTPIASSVFFYKKNEQTLLANQNLQDLLQKQRLEAANVDTGALRKQYLSIDEKLQTINKFLKARGLKPLAKAEGGAPDKNLGTTEEIGTFYEAYLKKMVRILGYTPIGLPHFGKVSSNFGHRENPFTGANIERHNGIDIKGKQGEIVRSTANGRVTFAGWKGGYGNCIVINHQNGYETYYGHLSKITVKVNQTITIGQQIGKVGSTGRSTGPHLHYEIHKNGKPINPKLYLNL